MNPINASEFAAFYGSVYGQDRQPFPWQVRLLNRVLAQGWPNVIALPTASGKTTCIDIAVFALACQAHLPAAERSTPRRIFFVVDRRVIVDEAYEQAQALAEHLRNATGGVSYAVADALRTLAGGEDPLVVFQLRGGLYRDDNWARTPIQPTVITSTVDQIGSRLLFRGYGLRGGSMWPVHAGLAANDSLVILDEAHCARPFGETAAAIQRYRLWATASVARPFSLVSMTATPPSDVSAGDVVHDEADDRAHPILGARLKAAKPTALVVAERAKGVRAIEALADELVAQARFLASHTSARAIGLIVNRVAEARRAFAQLGGHVANTDRDHDVVLLIGRMRSLDRDRVTQEWLSKLRAGEARERHALVRPVFVVATQTLEVGANLDFDALVTECASLDALRQRFGRLNRLGRAIPARGVIVIRADQVNPREDDPIYGPALPATWAWLNENAEAVETTADGLHGRGNVQVERVIDFGVSALNERLQTPENAERWSTLQAPAPSAPVMLPVHVDCWAQTAPPPAPSPEPALFLHGPDTGAPDVQVVLRADLDPGVSELAPWVETVSLCPPASGEYLPVPLTLFRRWMRGIADEDLMSGDVLGVGDPQDSVEPPPQRVTPHVLRWMGPDLSELTDDPRQIRPGDTVVVPTACEGWAAFGHIPEPDRDLDLAEQAHWLARRQPVLRFHPNLSLTASLVQALSDTEKSIFQTIEVPEDLAKLRTALASIAALSDSWVGRMARELAQDPGLKVVPHPFGGIVVLGRTRTSGAPIHTLFSGEDHTSVAGAPATLEQHCRGVSRYAHLFAEGSGLPQEVVEDITLAGLLHDFGKGDPRFQLLLHDGNRWKAAAAPALMAKSERMPDGPVEYRRLLERSGYPKGSRHELLSIRLIESAPQALAQAHDPELVLHLIAAHHGHCRPFAPVVMDDNPVEVAFNLLDISVRASSATGLERLGSGVAQRFWRLTRRYGWWGLAYLEAMIRLADHFQSATERISKETT